MKKYVLDVRRSAPPGKGVGTPYEDLTPGLWYTDDTVSRWYVWVTPYTAGGGLSYIAFTQFIDANDRAKGPTEPRTVKDKAGLTQMLYHPLPNAKVGLIVIENSEQENT